MQVINFNNIITGVKEMRASTMLVIIVSFFAVTGNAIAGTGKMNVCHKGNTINISTSAEKAHLDHGDFPLECEKVPQAVALFQCGGSPELMILSISASDGVPQYVNPLTPIAAGDSCAETVRLLINNGYTATHANTVYDANLLGIVTDYGFTGPRKMYEVTP